MSLRTNDFVNALVGTVLAILIGLGTTAAVLISQECAR